VRETEEVKAHGLKANKAKRSRGEGSAWSGIRPRSSC
jgi:hypothetical protein